MEYGTRNTKHKTQNIKRKTNKTDAQCFSRSQINVEYECLTKCLFPARQHSNVKKSENSQISFCVRVHCYCAVLLTTASSSGSWKNIASSSLMSTGHISYFSS